jgi:hypothetical protein
MTMFDNLQAYDIRREMAALGWYSDDRITTFGWGDGIMGYSIWFSRWDWHGMKHYGPPTYHAHTSDLTRIDQAVREAALRALDAYERFPDFPPNQLTDNSLRVDETLRRLLQKAKTDKDVFAVYEEQGCPGRPGPKDGQQS